MFYRRSSATDPGGSSGMEHKPHVVISFGEGKSPRSLARHREKARQFRDFQRLLTESANRRVRAFAESAVANLKLDEDMPL